MWIQKMCDVMATSFIRKVGDNELASGGHFLVVTWKMVRTPMKPGGLGVVMLTLVPLDRSGFAMCPHSIHLHNDVEMDLSCTSTTIITEYGRWTRL